MALISSSLSSAIVLWTGHGTSPSPVRDDVAVLRRFGAQTGPWMLNQLRMLEVDFYDSRAFLDAENPVPPCERAAAEFRQRHPEITEDAVAALAWCYGWDYP